MPDVKDCLSLAAAADRTGIARTTIHSAVKRGDLRHYLMGDGDTRVVRIVDVDKWAKADRKPGPKPKAVRPAP